MVGFVTAPSIAWGTGALEQLSGLGASRVLLVVDPAVRSQEGPRRAAEELARSGASVVTVEDRPPSVRVEAVVALADRLRAADPDWVVAVGGGTTVDLAKAARLLFERPEIDLVRPPVDLAVADRPRCHLAAVPTTAGSGAEASLTVDLFGADEAPFELADRTLVPDWAIVDPVFVQELPLATAVAGAFEAAALASEAYVSAWANPFSDALASDALRTIVHRLPHAVRWSDDPDAREALQYAATAAGLAASNAQRGLAHALGRALVRPTGLPYATLVGMALPPTLEFDRPGARERLESLAELLRAPAEPATVTLAERLRRLAGGVGAPLDLRTAGVDPATIERERPRIVTETLRSPSVLANPRVPTPTDVDELVGRLVGGDSAPAGRSRVG